MSNPKRKTARYSKSISGKRKKSRKTRRLRRHRRSYKGGYLSPPIATRRASDIGN